MNLVNNAWIAPCCPVAPQSLIQGGIQADSGGEVCPTDMADPQPPRARGLTVASREEWRPGLWASMWCDARSSQAARTSNDGPACNLLGVRPCSMARLARGVEFEGRQLLLPHGDALLATMHERAAACKWHVAWCSSSPVLERLHLLRRGSWGLPLAHRHMAGLDGNGAKAVER